MPALLREGSLPDVGIHPQSIGDQLFQIHNQERAATPLRFLSQKTKPYAGQPGINQGYSIQDRAEVQAYSSHT